MTEIIFIDLFQLSTGFTRAAGRWIKGRRTYVRVYWMWQSPRFRLAALIQCLIKPMAGSLLVGTVH